MRRMRIENVNVQIILGPRRTVTEKNGEFDCKTKPTVVFTRILIFWKKSFPRSAFCELCHRGNTCGSAFAGNGELKTLTLRIRSLMESKACGSGPSIQRATDDTAQWLLPICPEKSPGHDPVRRLYRKRF